MTGFGAPATDQRTYASRAPYLRKLIADHFPVDRSSRIFDLGCGAGALIRAARSMGYEDMTGVDLSHEQVESARRQGIDGVREGNLLHVLREVPAGSYDAVIAFDVIEHFDLADLHLFISESHRVLRPGGRMILHTPNAESPFFGRVRYGDLTHEWAFTRSSMHQLLSMAGFTRIASCEDRPVGRGLRGVLRRIVWSGIRLALRLYVAAETGDTGKHAIFTQNMLVVAYR